MQDFEVYLNPLFMLYGYGMNFPVIGSVAFTLSAKDENELFSLCNANHTRNSLCFGDETVNVKARSMSVGDVVFNKTKKQWLVVEPMGWRVLENMPISCYEYVRNHLTS